MPWRWQAPGSRCSAATAPDRDRLAAAELGADRAEPTGEYRIVLPDGQPLPEGTQIIGRGSRLHFLAKTSWYQLDVDDIPG